MAGIFPASTDGGIAPNPGDPANPIRAYPPAFGPADTAALYYSNGCDVRLRPEVLNSLISEVEAVVDEAGLNYLSSSQQNMEVAIRYLIQRGIPHAAAMLGGAFDYTMTLDPPPARLTDWMLAVVTPETNNQGPSRLNTNGLGLIPVLHCDGTPLGKGDLLAQIPVALLFFQNNWYYVGLAPSQIGRGPVNSSQRYDVPGVYSFVVPVGISTLFVQAWGGGGSGAATAGAQDPTGGGGGGGGYVEGWVATAPGATHAVTVGAGGGLIGPNSGLNGTSGSSSIFKVSPTVSMTAFGGGGGFIAAASTGSGGPATGGQFTMTGGPGEDWGSQRRVCNGGQAGFGGGAGGLHGASPSGQKPGGGGGGGNSSAYGGAGGSGSVVLRW